MISRIRKFRDHSKIRQIDMYMRWALYACPWLFIVFEGLALLGLATTDRRGLGLGTALLVVAIVQAMAGVGLLRRALDRYLGKETVLRARMAVSFVLLTAALCLIALISTHGSKELAQGVSTMVMGVAIAPLGALCLIVRKRVYWALCAAGSLVVPVPFVLVGMPFAVALGGSVFGALFIAGWVQLVARVSGWMLSIMWEVDGAREVQARLAVVEERLRFSRDMHDVLGRNLAAVALKSELAVQLARRGSDAAVDQMAEVQRIAQESQRELREVVRGYREADLHTELAGARGILTAAGIECRIDARAADDLPPAVQSTLAWVVREATTNVLRHSDAGRCALRLRWVEGGEGRAVLTVENDGVRVGSSGGSGGSGAGSGLAGLRERLAVLGGTLAYEHGGNGTFLLTARVPVGSAPPEADAVTGGTPPGNGEGVGPGRPSPAAAVGGHDAGVRRRRTGLVPEGMDR
ncbi:sensor histidine kinase [Streptomyces hesseae]|uniref:Histidine kinase n=1 Tax=Streptomyces hesseae TaxID=3075519 RepID=A0ABU2SS46_9ACTN|nr:histidine kinase [Streptomyces sp. DSM 40473]MDT0451471.1 histidine kinase [Streptomyces sp. DSM 40473]